jgi:hypothetical protein
MKLRSVLVDALLLAGWLGSVGMVLLHERGHVWGRAIRPLASLRATLEVNEQWFGLYYQGQKIGYAQTTLIPEERNGIPGVSVLERGRIVFTLMGLPQQVDLSAQAFIDADWRLQDFAAELQADTYRFRWRGRREGETLVMTVQTGESQQTMRLRDPGGSALVAGLSPWTAFHRLREGQWGSAWIVNPLALAPEQIYFHVRGREQLDGQAVLRIETDFRGVTTTSWVTPDGEVLREESPLGWQLIRESQEEALGALQVAAAVDLLSAVAVPIDRPLPHPERVTKLVCLIEGLTAEELTVERPWQQVLPPETLSRYRAPPPSGAWCLLELRRPLVAASTAEIPPAVARYRKPSLFVQSDDPRIAAMSRDILGDLTDRWQQAQALNAWVYRSLAKRLTVGLPSATDVLASRAGDCHEHTILLTALARSAGLPTRMVAGLVYYDGRLYYHAWPEVWLEEWVPLDPTFGQAPADATHLGLLGAENEELLSLAQFIGQLRMTVLAVEEE